MTFQHVLQWKRHEGFVKTGQAFAWANSHTANLAEEGWCQLSYCTLPAESLHSVVKGRISNFCKRKKRVPMCCGVLRRSCETRKMIMNKGRNSACWSRSKTTKQQILNSPNQRIIYAGCYGNCVLDSIVPSFNLEHFKRHPHTHTLTPV